MSIETEFRAALAAHAPLVALVGSRIAQDAVPEGSEGALVVYSARHDYTLGLGNELLADQCTLAVQCWAETGALAGQVANEVTQAVALQPVAQAAGACVTDRATTFDPETGLDGVLLTVEWWA